MADTSLLRAIWETAKTRWREKRIVSAPTTEEIRAFWRTYWTREIERLDYEKHLKDHK